MLNKIQLILSILFLSCSFVTDSNDSASLCEPDPCLNEGECRVNSGAYTCTCQDNYSGNNCENYNNPLVGTWNVTTIKYFETLDCSGAPIENLDVNSLEELATYGADEYQTKITLTVDSYIIAINTLSLVSSDERVEDVSTGIMLDHGNQYCVIWNTGDGDHCNECRDYTINDDEAEFTSYNCPDPVTGQINIPCIIYTLVKQ